MVLHPSVAILVAVHAGRPRDMSQLSRRHFRARSEDGGALVEPPLNRAADLVAQNRARSSGCRYDCQGLPLEKLVFRARDELRARAIAFTAAYRDTSFVPSLAPWTPFILSGHQPELYHSGVWFKSFLLSAASQ